MSSSSPKNPYLFPTLVKATLIVLFVGTVSIVFYFYGLPYIEGKVNEDIQGQEYQERLIKAYEKFKETTTALPTTTTTSSPKIDPIQTVSQDFPAPRLLKSLGENIAFLNIKSKRLQAESNNV